MHVLTLMTTLEEAAPPGLVAACWWEGRGQGCVCVSLSPGEAGSRTEVKWSQVQMSAAETLPKQDKQHNSSAFHHEQ